MIGSSKGYAFPLVAEGTELGHLYFERRPQSPNVLDAAAPIISSRIKQALVQAQWHNDAVTDPLTGLLNRRGLELRGHSLLALARRYQQTVSVVMLDLDLFKKVNDRYGHPVGDQALATLARVLKRNVRDEDLVVRWGGEEFVLILYGARLEKTQDIVKRIHYELRIHPISPIDWPLTVSVGVVAGEVPQDENTLMQWIGKADRALLRAKKAGRDRVEIAVSSVQTLGD